MELEHTPIEAKPGIFEHRPGLAIRIVIAEVLFLAVVWWKPIDFIHEFAHADLEQYRLMAHASPGIAHNAVAPFAYRVLGPWLAGLFTSYDAYAFRVLSVLALIGIGLCFFTLMRQRRASESQALLATTLLLFNPYGCGMMLFNRFQVNDALSLLAIIACFIFVEQRKLAAWAIVLSAGVLARETVLLMIPVSLVYLWSRDQKQLIAKASALSVPAIVLFLSIRMLVRVSNADWSLMTTVQDYAPGFLRPELWGRLLLNTCAPLSLIPFVQFKQNRLFFKQHPEYLVFGVLLMASALIGADTERLFSPFVLVVILYIHSLLSDYSLYRDRGVILSIIVCMIVCAMHFMLAQVCIPDKLIYYSSAAGASLLLAVLMNLMIRSRERQTGLVHKIDAEQSAVS